MTQDLWKRLACERRPEVAAMCGMECSLGGRHPPTASSAAYATVWTGAIDGNGYEEVIGAQSKSKRAQAKGRRDGDVWICAENDTFNSIIEALGHGERIAGWRSKLQRLNPDILLDTRAKCNTRLKNGVKVRLSSSARKPGPDPATPCESGMSPSRGGRARPARGARARRLCTL